MNDHDAQEMQTYITRLEKSSADLEYFSAPVCPDEFIKERYIFLCKLVQQAFLPENQPLLETTRRNALLQLRIGEAQSTLKYLRDGTHPFAYERTKALHALEKLIPVSSIVTLWKN